MMPYMSIMSTTPKAGMFNLDVSLFASSLVLDSRLIVLPALSAVIVSAVVKNVVMPTKLLQLKGTDSLVGIVTAFVTAITSPTIGFGCGVVVHTTFSIFTGEPKKKVA